MRPLVVWVALLVVVLLAATLWLRGGGPARVEGAAPPRPASTAPPVEPLPGGGDLVEIADDTRRAPAEAPAAARVGEPTTGPAASATASIRGTVRRQLHTYYPEVVDRVRATFEAGVVPRPEQLDQAWEQLGLPLQISTVEPLAGVEVTVELAQNSASMPSATRAVTDEAGEFLVDFLPVGSHEVRVTPPAGSPRRPHDDPSVYRSVHLEPGELKHVDFDLPAEAAALSGRVVDSAGRPVEDAEVKAALFVVPQVGIPAEVRAQTDAQGRYSLSGLSPASLQRGIELALVGARTELRGPAMVAVDVVARGHVPARMLALPMTQDQERAVCSVVERLYSWRQAVGTVEWLPFDVEPPYTGAARPVFAEGAQVLPDIVLTREASVSGRVMDTGGEPLALAEVRVVSTGSPPAKPGLLTQAPVLPGWTRTDGRGVFGISGIVSGGYSFEVRTEADGLQRAISPPIEVVEGAALHDVQVVVRADEKGRIAGTAVDARTGEPLQAFRLEIQSTQGRSLAGGKEGSFQVDKVQEGPVSVRFHARDYASETLECVVRGGETTELRATLARAGHLHGSVTLDGDSPQGMLSVYVDDGSGERVHYGWFEGNYRTSRLRPGRPYRLVAEVQLAPGSESKLVAHASAVPLTDEDTQLDLRLERPAATLEGSVRIGGELQAWFVYALDGGAGGLDEPGRNPLLRAVAEGRRSPEDFQLALAPGTYTLLFRVLRKDAQGGPPTREDQICSVQVAGGDGTHLVLEAP